VVSASRLREAFGRWLSWRLLICGHIRLPARMGSIRNIRPVPEIIARHLLGRYSQAGRYFSADDLSEVRCLFGPDPSISELLPVQTAAVFRDRSNIVSAFAELCPTPEQNPKQRNREPGARLGLSVGC
jgi:hypothetical protein